ncbi:Transcription factor IIA, alpha/beta subunit family protein [Brugia malayi]|uniref:BMA-PQN-51, isoform b n=4 Tax=Brugia malayi TaxID=6279 RepID=A0A1U7F2W6_BRUMA|nr:Transcription factor IIA, alpha/beta subunit family protein [Brugia malayi]CDQ03612.1 BMA-PQN-51, isoform b [Brugia malayi]VIO98004.1 Transcription factor IIA, alpha/beta subunit family protein [Brugia malayi]
MSQQQQAGHTIADVYKGVINDVIGQVKEAFLDENVDIDVLQQLKKDWEEKLIASNSVDWDGPRHVPPPPLRQMKQPIMTSTTIPPGSTVRIAQNGQHILVQQSTRSSSSSSSQVTQPALVMQASGTSSIQRPVHQVQYISAANIPINSDPNTVVIQRQSVSQNTSQITTVTPGMITFPAGQGQARIIQQGGQQFLMHGSGTANLPTGSSVMILNAGSQIPVTLNNAVVYQPANRQLLQSGQSNPKLEDTIQMLDGATSLAVNTSGAGSSRTNCKYTERKTDKKCTLKKLAQLDGASRVSDSSSEEEMDEEDDDDPLRTIADRISEEGNAVDDEDQVTEEDPLNSGDDQSDDEDVERLFEAENLVMCQFEKVHRARSKWKFTLKDGIMHIRGKDHCFQRCSGEAEW